MIKITTEPFGSSHTILKADPTWWSELPRSVRAALLGFFWESDGWVMRNEDVPKWVADINRVYDRACRQISLDDILNP